MCCSTCFSSLVLVPMEKLLKSTLSTPSVFGEVERCPACPAPRHESLGCQADADAADGLAQVGDVAHEAEVKFVHGGRAERFGIAQGEQLRAARN